MTPPDERPGSGPADGETHVEGRDPQKKEFTPEVLDRSVIAIPLLDAMAQETRKPPPEPKIYDLIIDVNLEFREGRPEAKKRIEELVDEVGKARGRVGLGKQIAKTRASGQYVFASLDAAGIQEIVQRDFAAAEGDPKKRAIYRVWPDFEIRGLISASTSTVKADAARSAFAARGTGIVWAVLDSGIQGDHPHFAAHQNLANGLPQEHYDFTALPGAPEEPLVDGFGHGTHVAGIIAGEMKSTDERPIRTLSRHRDEKGKIAYASHAPDSMAGMAPECKLVSMKVLDSAGRGKASNLIAAVEQIQEINGYGRRLRIHGVNMSVGYDFEPEWFACGQSPLCVEVDRLVRSGVVVVVAAGNTGYGYEETQARGRVAAGIPLSINDPGNAELAITVGATHRDMPHVYGVSYFSSKGPTGDGRIKPDLVAPGEKILSCAAGAHLAVVKKDAGECDYLEQSGTSMAAPHVSGVIAAFLSVRREFIGQPERVKEIFLATATDLKRDRYFQGNGLVDLMRAIQSV